MENKPRFAELTAHDPQSTEDYCEVLLMIPDGMDAERYGRIYCRLMGWDYWRCDEL